MPSPRWMQYAPPPYSCTARPHVEARRDDVLRGAVGVPTDEDDASGLGRAPLEPPHDPVLEPGCRAAGRRPAPPSPPRSAMTTSRRPQRSSGSLGDPTAAAMVLRHAAEPRASVGDAHALHDERGAAAPRARRRGLRRLLRAAVRRGRGAVARDGPPPRLRLRDPPDARRASAGRRADPARGGLPGGARSRRCSRTPSTSRCRATRSSRRCSSRATSCPGSSTRAGSSARPASTGSSRSR